MAAQKLVTVYGTEKANMQTGKAYQVTEEQANVLISKGSATATAPKKAKGDNIE